jgi:hypothetical protein
MSATVGGRENKRKTGGQRHFAGRGSEFGLGHLVRHFFHSVYAGIVVSSVLLAACGNGNDGNNVSIKSPTSQNQYSIANNQVTLGGTASIYCDVGCSGAGTSTASKIGVTVNWENTTSGVGGGSSQSVDVCWFVYSFYCNHTWRATVPLVPGDNLIRVASSSQGGWGYDYILVHVKDAVPPTVKSVSASNISAYTARASVDVETGALDTVVNTVWSLDANFTNIVFSMSTNLAAAPYQQTAQFDASSLQYGTEYFVRANAYNANGSSGTLTTSFTTSTNVNPVAHTLDATTTLTSASLNSEINPMGFATDAWFEWGTDSSLAGASETPHAFVGSGKSFNNYWSSLTGLVGGTTYYYRARASSSMGAGTGAIRSFVASTVPTVSTYDASNIGTDTVVLRGSVNPNYDTAEAWFEWGTDSTLTTYTSTTPESVGAGGSGSVYSKTLSGLSPSQTYYFRVVARNGHGEVRGSIVSVTSLAVTPPSASTVTVNNMTSTTATFNGTVNPNGLATNAWFEWGTDSTLATYTATSPVALDYPAVDNNVSTPVSGLTYNVTYYVRAVASSNAGTTRGAITGFQTVTPPTVQTQAATSVLARSGALNGTVNPNGSGTTAWFEVGWDPNLSTLFRFSTANQGMGNGTVALPLASTLNDLSSSTTYYYRAVGSNAGATVNGATLSFTTPVGNYGCWSKTYGRYAYQSNDVGQAIATTSDGGMIIAGKSTVSAGWGFSPGAWVLKLGPEGGVQWQELFFNTPYDVPVVKEVASGGYLVGTTTSLSSRELWLIKLDANGQVEWEKSLANGYQTISDIDVLSDGYIVTAATGTTLSVHRLATDGTVVWRETFDGIASGSIVAVDAVSDGFVIATTAAGLGAGGNDVWVLKLAQDGTPQWQYAFGGPGDERASDVLSTADGIFVMGTTASFGSGQDDIWLLRLSIDGNVTGEQVYGTSAVDSGGSIKAVGSAYLAAGKTNGRLWLASLATDGSITWQKDYPVSPTAWPNSVDLTSDSGFVVASGTTDINATRLPGDGACPGFDADSALTRAATTATRTSTSILPGSLPATANDLSVVPTATYAKILQIVPVP